MSALDWFVNTPQNDLEALELAWQLLVLALLSVGFVWMSRGGCDDQ